MATAKELKIKVVENGSVVNKEVIVEYAKKDSKGNQIDTTYAKKNEIPDGAVTAAAALTANKLILGNGNKTVKTSTYEPASSSTTWSATSEVYLPTMKSIENRINFKMSNVVSTQEQDLLGIIVGNGQQDITDSGKSFAESSSSWSQSDVLIPTMKLIDIQLQDIREIAEGKSAAFVIESKSAITGTESTTGFTGVTAITTSVGSPTFDKSKVKLGDVINNKTTTEPDYWVSGIIKDSGGNVTSVNLNFMETAKQKVTDVQIGGVTQVSNTVVNLQTEGTYNASSNKLATKSYVTGLGYQTSSQVSTTAENVFNTKIAGYATQTWVEGKGYLTGITSAMVTTALGFTPYNATNPSGYQTSSQVSSAISTALASYLPKSGGIMTGDIHMHGNAITFNNSNNKELTVDQDENLTYDNNILATQTWTNGQGFLKAITGAMVTTALGFTPYNATNPSGYQTASQVSSAISTAITDMATQTWVNERGFATQVWVSAQLDLKEDLFSSTHKLSASYISGLASVATSGSYNSLTNKPDIPDSPEDVGFYVSDFTIG